MVKENIDHLVLGCSHYPFLIPIIKKIIPENISIIDSGKAVAKQVEIILSKQNSLSINHISLNQFFTNSDTTVIKEILNNNYPISKLNF